MFQTFDRIINEKNISGVIFGFTAEGKAKIEWDTGKKSVRKVDQKLRFWSPNGTHALLTRERKNAFSLTQIGKTALQENVILQGDPRFEEGLLELETAKEFGFDLETLGYEFSNDALIPAKGDIRLIQVYLPQSGNVLIWDLGGIDGRSENLRGRYDLTTIPGGKLLAKKLSSSAVRKFIHNSSFELLWIAYKFGVNIFNVVDSMLLSQVYWAGLFPGMQAIGMKDPNSLKWVAFRLGFDVPSKEDQKWDYGYAIGNRQLNYGANDAILTYRCGKRLLELGEKFGLINSMQAELAMIPSFGDMRYKGFPVCPQKLQQTLTLYQSVVRKLEDDWEGEFPGVNPYSSPQAAQALSEVYDLQLETHSKITGRISPSTAYEVLAPYFERYPITEVLANLKSVKKGLDYLLNIQEILHENESGIPVVCGGFVNLAAQACGRSSCKKPINLQNPPKCSTSWKTLGLTPIRDVFRMPPGYKLIALDLSGCHGQIARFMSQEPGLIEANELGIKFHYYTARGILQLKGYDLTPAEIMAIKKDENHPSHEEIDRTYEFSKKAFYTWLNGGGGGSLHESFLGDDPPQFVPRGTCDELMKGTRAAYPRLKTFMYGLSDVANKVSYTIPVWFDAEGNPIHWGYYGKLADNKERLIRPPGVDENAEPRYVGQNTGKYCGRLPETVRIYGEIRALDGGRYFVQKYPNKFRDGAYSPELGDCTAFTWQRTEKTGIANAASKITEKFYATPNWDGWIACLLHDELDIVVKEEFAEEAAWFCFNAINECMRELIKDFTSETKNPYKENVHDNWKK